LDKISISLDFCVRSFDLFEDAKIKEIRSLVEHNNISQAIKRLMAFSDLLEENRYRDELSSVKADFKILQEKSRTYYTPQEEQSEVKKFRYDFFQLMQRINLEYIEQQNRPNLDDQHHTNDKNSFWGAKKIFEEKRASKAVDTNHTNIAFIAHQITKRYNKKDASFALNPIDVELKYGEITVVVGKNGHGKTTLLNIIAGELLHSSGTVEYPALFKKYKDDYYNIKDQISYISAETKEWKETPKILFNFLLASQGIYGEENEKEVDWILERLDLREYQDRKWKELSTGYKMRFVLAKAMLEKPKLLILDEPLANLDVKFRENFLADIKDMSEQNMALIISSHNIHEIEDIADNLIFLDNGTTTYNGKISDLDKINDENSYEVGIRGDLIEIERVLVKLGYKSSDRENEYRSKYHTLKTSKDISSTKLLSILLENNLEIYYFRDISKSSKKLFGGNNG